MPLPALLSALKGAVERHLEKTHIERPSESDIIAAVNEKLPGITAIFEFTLDESLREKAVRTMLALIPVQMRTGAALKDRSLPPPWVDSRNLGWQCWNSYETYLYGKMLPKNVIMTLGNDTRRILDALGDPSQPGTWDRRGLVLGHVQSGKTSNYAGLLCRAADAGYKLFIVITGIHENLRAQTQQRINEGFINLAPAHMKPISLTSTEDFSWQKAEQQIPPQAVGTSVVLVVKKNSRVLENLLQWLRDSSKPNGDWADMPLLLIDDESDNASVNTNKEEFDPTKINRMIRSILNIFRKSSYVGYTATPFANIFIDPDSEHEMYSHDLFPKDFIYCLSSPDNYFSAEKIFFDDEESPRHHLVTVNDAEDVLPRSAKSRFIPEQLPGSLIEAVKTFFIACAIRTLRGDGTEHMSMLVNVSPYAAVQEQVKLLLDDEVQRLRNIICASARMSGQENLFWLSLEAMFNSQYSGCGISWEDIRRVLPEIARSMQLRVINSKSQDVLKYQDYTETGLHVIAVGGYTLSRGLTLEGLMISYWNRNSKAYDTLLQMGRWFGYRDKYEDLCRIWMPLDAQEWYAHIAEISQELRDDLISMTQRGLTPADFGLKVRNHPETLVVTAMNKRRSAKSRVVRPDLSGSLVETWAVYNDQQRLNDNLQAMTDLIRQATTVALPESEEPNSTAAGSFLWRSVPTDLVEKFFHAFQAHPSIPYADNKYLFAYLNALKEKLRGQGNSLTWDVGLFSAKQHSPERHRVFADLEVWKQLRSLGSNSPAGGFSLSLKQRVASKGVESLPLSAEQKASAMAKWASKGGSKQMADHWYRRELERPLLMLHLIDLQDDNKKIVCKDVAAWGASFPPYEELRIQANEYTVSRNWLKLYESMESEPEDE